MSCGDGTTAPSTNGIVGTWGSDNPGSDYLFHFLADGSFTFGTTGLPDAYTGTYKTEGNVIFYMEDRLDTTESQAEYIISGTTLTLNATVDNSEWDTLNSAFNGDWIKQ